MLDKPKPILTKIYYLLPIILFLLQALYTFNSLSQILWEEIEQLRDNYWFAHHLIWQAGYTNFGTYATVDLINSIFGFHLFNFKYFKLFLHLISLFCTAFLLKKYLGVKLSIIPLLVFGLSPTLLYFNTSQTLYGLDLQYFPILLFLVIISFKNPLFELIKIAFFWMILMWGWLSYPTMAFYIPALGLIFIIQLWKRPPKERLLSIPVSLVSFLIPLIFSVLWVQNRELLFDFRARHGLLLSGGTPMVEGDLSNTIYQALSSLVTNLFIKSAAYHFEVTWVDFSGFLPVITFLFITIAPIWYLKKVKEIKLAYWLCIATILLNTILSSIAVWSSIGFRRNTPVLASIYCLFALSFYLFFKKRVHIKLPRKLVGFLLGILLIHHIIVYPLNLMNLKTPSPFKDGWYFSAHTTPEQSVKKVVDDITKSDVYLNCQEQYGFQNTECPYMDFYAAVMSTCFWNNLSCHKMYGYSPVRQQYEELSMDLFSKIMKDHYVAE